MFRRALRSAAIPCVLVGLVACQAQDADPEDLDALLRDGELKLAEGGGPRAAKPAFPFDFSFGQWTFDDCTPVRTQLGDSAFFGNTAFRSVSVTCAEGVGGQAVSLFGPEDIVYVPDQPDFTFQGGVTVAGWFKPNATGGTRTLIRKRDQGTSSLALMIVDGNFKLVIALASGRTAAVTSPAKAKKGVFQHVAGTYDGQVLRLYVDGAQVASRAAPGTIPPGAGPLLIGNDGSLRLFSGLVDEVLFDGRALSADEILELSCVRQEPTFLVSPRESAPTPPGVPATFDIAVTNRNSSRCPALTANLQLFSTDGGITTDPAPGDAKTSAPIPSGATGHLTLTATAGENVEPATFLLFFQVVSADPRQSFFFSDVVNFVVTEATGCHVSVPRELMIKSVSVVDDPARTTGTGAWTFAHLAEEMAPTPADAPAMVEEMLSSFTVAQTINGFTVAPRPGMQTFILDTWPRTPGGALDLAQAPLRLSAIVPRFDLRNAAAGDAGELRFVYTFNSSFGFPLQAMMILEYKLPAASPDEALAWAQAFHGLGALPFSEEYNAALEAITERVVARGARPGRPNGSALATLRTNEIDFGGSFFVWEMREFRLSQSGGLAPAPVKLTPDRSLNGSDALAAFINANAPAILADAHDVPEVVNGQPFLGGSAFNDFSTWSAPGIADGEARHHFALNTCNGCHSGETNNAFTQISPRFPGSESSLSGFLTGTTVFDPFSGRQRTFNDLARRARDLKAVVCAQ